MKSGGKDDGQGGALRKALMHAAQPDESAGGCTKIAKASAEDSSQMRCAEARKEQRSIRITETQKSWDVQVKKTPAPYKDIK